MDHMGLAGNIAVRNGAEVFIHPWDRDKIPLRGESWLGNRLGIVQEFLTESAMPEKICRQILDNISDRFKRFVSLVENISILNGHAVLDFDDMQLEIIHTPGHSPGSICLFNRDSGTLLAGDCLLEKITPNPVVEIKPPREAPDYLSVVRYEQTLKMMADLTVRNVLPGHGPPFDDHAGIVRRIQRHHHIRSGRVLNLLKAGVDLPEKDGGLTLYQVVQQLFPDISGVNIFLALSEAVGHLDYLRSKGAADMLRKRGVRVYRWTGKGARI